MDFFDFALACFHQLSAAEFELFAIVVWRIWYRRNQWVHLKVELPPHGVTDWAKTFLVDFQSASRSSSSAYGVPPSATSCPAPVLRKKNP
ncbi:hypothetical protein ACOSQ3_006873 [Xanthoceras sorbifolium]